MKKILRLSLALVLSISMIFSSLIFASADVVTVTDETALRDALDGDASTIYINGTVNLTAALDITRSVTIVGGTIVQKRTSGSLKEQVNVLGGEVMFKGTKLTIASGSSAPGLVIGGFAHVTLDGATVESTGNDTIYLNGDFTGMLNIINDSVIKRTGGLVFNTAAGSKGVINFISGTMSNTSGDSIKFLGTQIFNVGGVEGQTAKLDIYGDGFWFAGGYTVVNIYDGAVVNAKGKFCNMNSDLSIMNVYGGTITTPGSFIYTQKKVNVNIFGGTVSASGNFIQTTSSGTPKILITGGNFTCSASTKFNIGGTPNIDIAGGTYNFDPSAYVAAGYGATSSGGKYTVAANPGTPTVVSSSADFISAIDNGDTYIKLGASFTLAADATIDSEVYIDGNGYQITGGNQIIVSGTGNTVTLKNVKFTRGSDAVKVTSYPNLIISGGEIACTNTGSGNEGALFLADTCKATVLVTDNAVIKSSNWAVYTSANASQTAAVINLADCTVQKVSGGGQKNLINIRSAASLNIGGGADGQEVLITSGSGQLITNQNGQNPSINILDGANLKSTGSDWAVLCNTTASVNMLGGTLDANKGCAFVCASTGGKVLIAGGTITSTTNDRIFDKNNGHVLVCGGTFENKGTGAIFKTTKTTENIGSFFIEGENITIESDSPLFTANGAFPVYISDVVLDQESGIITIGADGGPVTLNNCQVTSAGIAINSASDAVITLTNNTVVSSTGNDPIVGGTVEKDGSSTIGVPVLHPLVQAVKDTPAGETLEITTAYTDVPAITIDKDITFTGIGSIAFKNAGFEIAKDVNVVFAEGSNINVTMGADDTDGSNKLFNLAQGASLTLSGGTFTGYISMKTGYGSKNTKVTVNDGATLNQKNYRLIEVSDPYTELVVNGGTFKGSASHPMLRLNDGTAVMKIYGGEFNYSGAFVSSSNLGQIVVVGNCKSFQVGDLATGKGPTMISTNSGRIIDFNLGYGIQNSSADVDINAGTFKQNAYGYNIYFNKAAKAPININGGTWVTRDLATVYVNDDGITDLRINGGKFETITTLEQTIFKKNGALTITGGHFIGHGAPAIIASHQDSDTGNFTINDAANGVMDDIILEHKDSGALIEHRSQLPLNIIDTNITSDSIGAGILVEKRTKSKVTIQNSNITTAGSALALGSDFTGASGATVEVINSTLTSTGSRGVDNKWGVVAGVGDTNYYSNIPNFTMDSTSKINDSTELRTNGKPKMFRFAGGSGSANTVAVSATTAELASGNYTLTLNYRETGGAWPYVGVTAGGKTTAVPKANFVDGVMTYTFSAEGEVKVSLGRETMHAAGAVYFGNVKLTANGSSDNLLTDTFNNANLARSPINTLTAGNAGAIIPGWTNENIGSFHGARVMEIPSEDFFTADNPKVAENYVYKFEDGDNMDVLLRFHMTEDTNYEFSYNYMSSDGNLRNKLYPGGMDRPFSMNIEQDEDSYKTIVKYTLGNDGDSTVENEGTTIYIDGPEDAYGSIQYLGNFEMYEIDGAGNRITGRNLLAGFSPMYETEGDLSHLGTYPMVTDSAVSSKLENAYGVYFRNDSSETDVASIVKVDDNFFKKSSFAERRGNARRYLIENDVHTDLAYDYSADKAVNVIDLLKVKKYESGFVGADDKAAALKSEILNAPDTVVPSGKTVYYVSNSGSDSNDGKSTSKPLKTLEEALGKVSSYSSSTTYILLERGGEWRIPSNKDSNGWKITKNNITIGTYTGNKGNAKPVLNGSVKNYAGKWTAQGNNIWKISLDNKGNANIPGNVYFYTADDKNATPAIIGTIVKDQIPIGQKWDTNNKWVDSDTPMAKLTKNGDVYKDYDVEAGNWLQEWLGTTGSVNNVYVYYDGDLNKDFARIEITESKDTIYAEGRSGLVFDNIEIKHAGAHGINLKRCTDVMISNCVVGYVGGAPSGNTALGNGIQFGLSGSNCTVNKTYVYQCYDAGISPQNWDKDTTYNFTNIVLSNNLLEKNFYNIEAWSDNGSMQMTVTGNILKDAAYGWSWNQRYQNGNVNMYGAHVYGGRNAYSDQLKLEFTNNIFDNTQTSIFCWFWGGKANAAELPATFPTTGSHYMTLSGNSYYQKAGSNNGGQVNLYGNTTDPAYASSQKAFEDVVRVLDPDAANAGRVTYLQQWLTDLAEQGDNEMVYNDITINNAKISGNKNSDDNYVIVNDTTTEYGTLAVNSLIKEVTGEYLAVADSVSAGDKAIRIITNTALAPNTVKVYVTGNTLYIAAHDTLFVDDAISVFKGILEDGKLTFANGYEKTITLSSYTYSGKSGLRLIGDSDKNPVSYNVGETATINIAGYASNGQIISVPQFKVVTFNEQTGEESDPVYYSGTTGVCSFTVSSNTPGFVYWTVVACDSNGNKISGFAEVDSNVHYSGSVGFGVKSIAKSSSSSKPADFDTQWTAAASEVAGVTLDLDNIATGNDSTGSKIEMQSVSANAGYEAYRVEIPYANAGGFVTGYLTYPKNASASSLGLMVRFQSNSIAAPDKNYDANAAVFTVCAHSLDLTKTGDTTYMDNFTSSINKNGKNFAWDNSTSDFNGSYLVKMVKRDLLAGKFMIEYFTEKGLWNGTTFTAKGTSMGGFQAIAVAALLDNVTGKKVTTLDVSLPWLCDLGAGSGNNRKKSSWRPTDFAYVDNVHFATMLGNDTVNEIIVNAGLGDQICPASGVMAFYNTISNNNNKTIIFRQNNTHSGGYNGAYYTIKN